MEALRLIFFALVLVAAGAQLRRVPRFWAFLFLFVVLFPKIALAAIPGNTTPLRVDDVFLGAILGGWMVREALVARVDVPPRSPLTPFLLLYLGCAGTSTLIGIAAMRVTPATGALHFLRFVEYSLLYYYFYRAIRPDEVVAVREVFRNTWLIVATIWIVQHGLATSAPSAPIDWSTYAPSFSATYDFGGYTMIATAFCYALWTSKGARDVATTIGLVVGLYVMFNGDSRASLLGLAVAIAFDLLLRLRLKVAVGLIAVGATMPYLVSSRKMTGLLEVVGELIATRDIDAFRQTFFSDPSISIRLENWQMALEHWRRHPLLGDGLGAFLGYVRIYDQQGTPDGWYIRTLAETGLLGLLAFALLLGGLLWTLLRAYRQFEEPLPRAIVYAGVLGLLATTTDALLIDTFVSYKIMGVFWMLMAIGTRIATSSAVVLDTAREPGPVPGRSPSDPLLNPGGAA